MCMETRRKTSVIQIVFDDRKPTKLPQREMVMALIHGACITWILRNQKLLYDITWYSIHRFIFILWLYGFNTIFCLLDVVDLNLIRLSGSCLMYMYMYMYMLRLYFLHHHVCQFFYYLLFSKDVYIQWDAYY